MICAQPPDPKDYSQKEARQMGEYRKSAWSLHWRIITLSNRRAMIRALAVACTNAFIVSACGGGKTSSSAQAARSSASATAARSAPPSPTPDSAPAPPSGSAAAPPYGSAPAPPSVSAPPPPSVPSPSQSIASEYLDALNPVAGSGNLFTGSVEVNGQYYANSVYLDLNPGPGNVSYNLGRQWRHLEATVGLSDDSPENEKVQFQIFADQRSIYNHVFELGQSQQINLNVSGVLRLELVATLTSAYVADTEAVWGDANLTV